MRQSTFPFVGVEFVYDDHGTYLGQWQDNFLDLHPSVIWFPAEIIDGVPHVNGNPVPPLPSQEEGA